MAMHDWALAYARRGWAVFPVHAMVEGRCTCGRADCHSPGKHPAVGGGFKDATTDEGRIRRWWSGRQDRNIAIATGRASGLCVLDVDVGEGKAGWSSLERLERDHGRLPGTLTVVTGSGGRHLYFEMPDGGIGSSAGRLGPNLDVRADGGYVVAPPSNHASGTAYTWESYDE